MDENRKHPRTLVHWRCAIVTETNGQRLTTQGMTNDISPEGVSVICHRNISPSHVVTVYLLIHTGDEDNPEVVFEAQGKVMNNVLSGKQGGFRLGIQFGKFVGESKNILQKYMPKSAGYGAAYAAASSDSATRPAKAAPPAKPAPAENAPAAAEAAPAVDAASPVEPAASAEAAPTTQAVPVENAAPSTDSAAADAAAPVSKTAE